MESSNSKLEAMKPVLFKAGIPLAVSLAGFVLAKIVTRKSSVPTASAQIQVENVDEDDHAYEEEILGLTRRLEEMQGKELQLEKRFLDYQGLKDQEMVLVDLHSKMMMEISRVEFLEREVSLVEAENRRFENVAKEYLELLRFEEFHRSENKRLHERVQKLLTKNKEHSRIVRKQCLQIRCKEMEISRSKNEIEELKLIIERLQGEKTVASKGEGEEVTVEDYNLLAHELDQLQKQKASEVGELINLKWSNACLKLELMRRRTRGQEHTQEIKETDNGYGEIQEFESDNELNECAVEEGKSYSALRNRGHAHARSKRRRLIEKFKRWVEGSEKCKASSLDEKEKHDGAEDAFLLARKSSSSA